MFIAVNATSLEELPGLSRSMFVDRSEQFIQRHKWTLSVGPDGLERDEYDDCHTTYCLVEGQGRHQASVRLRSVGYGCMVRTHFPNLWAGNAARLRDGVELTRFCSAPSLSPEDRITAVSDLLLGLCRLCQKREIPRVFGVVFPSVAKVIRQAGWAGETLSISEDARGTLVLAEWIPSDLVAWDIQEKREYREELMARRRARAEPMRSAA